MAFLDRFKAEKKTGAKASAAVQKTETKPKKEVKEKEAINSVPKIAPQANANAYRVLLRPLISEKTSRLEKMRQFVFAVSVSSNKVEIKKAVEKHYHVHVTSVNVVNSFGKKTGGRTPGQRRDWRKAYVTIRPGENITY
jgi:large subunit ribosomal protein L23